MKHKSSILYGSIFGLLLLSSIPLLKTDAPDFLQWYGTILIFGICSSPIGHRIFAHFHDKGWLFTKILGIAICGYLCWLFPAAHLLKFSKWYTIVITVTVLAGMGYLQKRRKISDIPWKSIFWEETLFLGMFLFWAYLSGFRPELNSTEKPMDFGIMASLDRSAYFPPADMWYGGEDLNYYYGGQYFAVYLSRIAHVSITKGYHLMKALIAAMAFCIPASLCAQMLRDSGSRKKTSIIGGLISGTAVCLSGNMHYVIFGLFRKVFNIEGDYSYSFSNSTRFIGYAPETMDKTIHEFPSYSFLLGDLHAHVINILFVLLFLGIGYAWLNNKEDKNKLKFPIACGCLIGLFMTINTWDWLIYLTVGFGICILDTLQNHGKLRGFLTETTAMAFCSILIPLPFLIRFSGSDAALGVALASSRSPLWQLLLLWGLPVSICLAFLAEQARLSIKTHRMPYIPDSYGILLSICAMGLIAIPEIVYVRDIYEQEYPRANTMFKLTYQAFILFGILIGYVLVRLWQSKRNRIFVLITLAAFILTTGYFVTGVKEWYGISENGAYQTLDGTAYMEEGTLDRDAINWISENINGQPVILTADGASYSNTGYISAMTGIPTVLGWHTHEWLWRGNYDNIRKISDDIKTIYTATEKTEVQALMTKYQVEYIVIGYEEWETYPDLNITGLRSLGTVIYEDGQTVIIKNK